MSETDNAGRAVILLDFDGVLIDSVDECAVSAYNQATGSFCRSLAELPAGYLELFRLNRPISRKAGEFKALAGWCLEQERSGATSRQLNEVEFQAINNPEKNRENGKEFFSFRQRLIDYSTEHWCELNPPIQPIWEWLRTNSNSRFTILTYKNLPAVKALCQYYQMPIDEADIYASDDGTTKAQNLLKIMSRHGSRAYHFIDDSLDNLFELKRTDSGVNLYWANWGYTLPTDQARAERYQIPSLSQTDAISLIADLTPK